MITTELLIIFFLLMLNAFFAMSEMAIVSSSKPLLRQKAKQGNKRAELALQLAEDSGRFLSTVQIGITLVGILAGAYSGAEIADKIAPRFNEIQLIAPNGELLAVILVVAIITYLWVVIGELIPKQFALSNSEAISMFIARPMYYLSVACTPVVAALEGSANLFFRIFGICREAEKVTEAEIRAILTEGVASGAIEQNEHEIIQRVIRLADREVQSIMTHRVDVTFIDVNDSIATIRQKVHEAGHSRYPVVDGDTRKVIGLVQAKKLLDAALTYSDDLHILDYIKEVPFLPEGTKCMNVLDLFKASSAHIAIVVDEYGSTEGIVTSSDILEAMVGIIPSNYNPKDEPLIIQREDGSWLVEGTTSIDEIKLSIGIEDIAADAGYETIAGFVIHAIGRKPNVGESIEKFGYRFEVVDIERQRIDKILIARIEHPYDGL